MRGKVSVDTQKLQSIRNALQEFNISMQRDSTDLQHYLNDKGDEANSNLQKKIREFAANEEARKHAEMMAVDEEDWKRIIARNNQERRREQEELNLLNHLIREFGTASGELRHHLRAMTGTYHETMERGVSVLGKSVQLLDSYMAMALSGSGSGSSGNNSLNAGIRGGLTPKEAAMIRAESGLPSDVINQLSSMNQYAILKSANLKPLSVNGKLALVRDIDPNQVDEFGRTNNERMMEGLSPLDPDGCPYELHHLGQHMDSTLAMLTRAEHRLGENHSIWHQFGEESQINRAVFDRQRLGFWESIAHMIQEGIYLQ